MRAKQLYKVQSLDMPATFAQKGDTRELVEATRHDLAHCLQHHDACQDSHQLFMLQLLHACLVPHCLQPHYACQALVRFLCCSRIMLFMLLIACNLVMLVRALISFSSCNHIACNLIMLVRILVSFLCCKDIQALEHLTPVALTSNGALQQHTNQAVV
eukprot:1160938-Pelagomonas_calceolata.AAC.6